MTANRYAQSYQQQQAGAWTRIDMVLALYDKTLSTLQQLSEAVAANSAAAEPLRLKASQLVLGICHGLDFEYGELPHSIAKLCEFVNDRIWNGSADDIQQCMGPLATVQEAYHQIRDEAAQLERDGKIPPPPESNASHRMA